MPTHDRSPTAPSCANCGAVLRLEHVQHGACGYCGAALPHVVRGAERAHAVEHLLADRDGDGVPDALAPLLEAQRRLELKRAEDAHEAERRFDRARALGELHAQRQIAAETTTVGWRSVLPAGALGALVFGFLWTLVVSEMLRLDPFFGAHAIVSCPLICRDCRAPYHFAPGAIWAEPYCQPGARGPRDTGERQRPPSGRHAEKRRLPGGMWTLFASSIALWLLPGMLVAALYFSAQTRGARQQIRTFDKRIAELERELGLSQRPMTHGEAGV